MILVSGDIIKTYKGQNDTTITTTTTAILIAI